MKAAANVHFFQLSDNASAYYFLGSLNFYPTHSQKSCSECFIHLIEATFSLW